MSSSEVATLGRARYIPERSRLIAQSPGLNRGREACGGPRSHRAKLQPLFARLLKISRPATLDMAPAICYPRPRSDGGALHAPPSMDGRIAQLVEQLTLNQRVQGSSPCAPTIFRQSPDGRKKRRFGPP